MGRLESSWGWTKVVVVVGVAGVAAYWHYANVTRARRCVRRLWVPLGEGGRGDLEVLVMPSQSTACEQAMQPYIAAFQTAEVLGLDAEWAPRARTPGISLLQLATSSQCLLFPLHRGARCLPRSLEALLADAAVVKAGVGIEGDALRLNAGHGVVLNGQLDVRALSPNHQSLSLAALSHEVLGLRLDKSLQTSDWGAETLSDAQLVYAAMDAWVSQQLVCSLYAAAEAHGEQQTLGEFVRPHVGVRVVGARTTRQSQRRADTAHTTARSGKPKSTARFGTRKAPLYENCRILAPDGAVLCTCSKKKIDWYVRRGIADLVGEEPPTVRLRFEPNGRTNATDQYYLAEKANKCAVCGDTRQYLRHSVVPPTYRQHFPEAMKSHLSHDIVLLCVPCKQTINSAVHARMVQLARQFDAPLEGGGEAGSLRFTSDEQKGHVRSAARALLKYHAVMPAFRVRKHVHAVRTYLAKADGEVVSEQELRELCGLQVRQEVEGYVAHAETVVNTLFRGETGWTADGDGCSGSSEGEGEEMAGEMAGWRALERFVRDWRAHFVTHMKPRHLPPHWCVDARVVNGNPNPLARDAAKAMAGGAVTATTTTAEKAIVSAVGAASIYDGDGVAGLEAGSEAVGGRGGEFG